MVETSKHWTANESVTSAPSGGQNQRTVALVIQGDVTHDGQFKRFK